MSTLAIVVLIFFCLAFGSHFLRRRLANVNWLKDADASMTALETMLTIAGILTAAGWYFIERPDAAKLNIELSAVGYRIENGYVLIVTEVNLENVGSSVINLREAPYLVSVQQVRPLTERAYNELISSNGAGKVRGVYPAETWGLRAQRISSLDENSFEGSNSPGLNSVMESGESENFYFRSTIPCRPNLVVATLVQVKKPDRGMMSSAKERNLYWKKQAFLDVSEQCLENDGRRE